MNLTNKCNYKILFRTSWTEEVFFFNEGRPRTERDCPGPRQQKLGQSRQRVQLVQNEGAEEK